LIIKERCSALGHLMVGAELGGQFSNRNKNECEFFKRKA